MGTLFKVVTKTSSSSRKRIWDMDCKYIKADTVLPYSSALMLTKSGGRATSTFHRKLWNERNESSTRYSIWRDLFSRMNCNQVL